MGLLALAVSLIGCSGSDEQGQASTPVLSVFQQDGEDATASSLAVPQRSGGDPIVESVDFEPADPGSGLRLRAIPRVSGEWTTLVYEWSVNGEPFGENSPRVLLPALSRGDTLGLRITPFRDESAGPPFEAKVEVANQKPQIRGLRIERVEGDDEDAEVGEATAAERWRARVDAVDPDGDEVEIEYHWLVNGREVESDGETFTLQALKPNDRIGVSARAYDGRVWSDDFRSGEIEVGDVPPSIVSVPPHPDATGYFRYVVQVEGAVDPSKLHFELRKSPEGMKIDEKSGVVTWDPEVGQSGRHDVEIVVRDEAGSEATQAFSLALTTTTEDSVPAAAR